MKSPDIHYITVIGAGQMGHQIAMLCALGEYETTIQDVSEAALKKAEQLLYGIMNKWVLKGKISEQQLHAALKRLSFTTNLERACLKADFIIEAVVEKLEVKREVFAKLEEIAPPHAIFATNSSTIVNSLLASVTNRPEKVINMHFFFPPLVMDCVEVVRSTRTSNETARKTMDVCEKVNRTAILLNKEISGFVANRLLGALQKEALALYEQGIAEYQDIDAICRKALHHPIGPFQLMDLSGIDVGYFVMQQRYEETGDPAEQPTPLIIEKIKKGHLGRKTGRGWYEYENLIT
ncbi:3-hydroxyacyl-CoA dehydrogenase family protein [Bacillus sp. 2205SS5-2]|uniref:3-hydroxyacyl-CoA dehydrogenase family protein n=1 Tax=Bacillus sp. 2205SS5-2 TaxID=3109031 RepID=UPI0030078C24